MNGGIYIFCVLLNVAAKWECLESVISFANFYLIHLIDFPYASSQA